MFKLGLIAAVAVMSGSACLAAPLETYGRLPSLETAALSPDGAQVAMVWTDGEQRSVVVRSLADGKLSQGVRAGDTKVRALQWAGPEHLLLITSQTKDVMELQGGASEWYLATDFNLKTGKLRPLLEDGESVMNVIGGLPEVRTVDGRPTVFVEGTYLNQGNSYLVPALFRIDLSRATSKRTYVGDAHTRDWLLGPDGEPVARIDYNAETRRWSLFLHKGSSWRESRVLTGVDSPADIVGFAADGESLLIEDPQSEGSVLRQVSADGAWGEALPASDALMFDAVSGKLVGFYRLDGDRDRFRFLDPAEQKAWDALIAKLPGARVHLESASDDRKVLLLQVDAPGDGPFYAVADQRNGKVMALGRVYEKIKPDDLSPVTPFIFEASDKTKLNAYLTVPRGAAPSNLPLVVLPHGGPASRDELGFDWWAQALASRGYAVLQVNFRGSEGYGDGFLKAGFGQWGRKMQTDLSDGVRVLAAEKIIDPKRVCIVGASYGGYAALAGAALDRGVYRCAASVAGPADLQRFVAWSKSQKGVTSQRYWMEFMGTATAKDAAFAEISPAAHAADVDIPVLLIHGKDDTVVPLEQSRIMADALKKAGKPVEMVTLNSTDHWLSRGETRLSMLQAVVAFLEKNNPPK